MAATKNFIIASVFVCFVISGVLCEQESTANGSNTNTNINNSNDSSDLSEGRTFSHHFLKRLSFAVIPGAFVVGVITTLLAALTVVSMKGLGVGVILLILAIGQMLSRTLPHVHATAAYAAPAPVPVVYSHSHTQQPVWLEKEWK